MRALALDLDGLTNPFGSRVSVHPHVCAADLNSLLFLIAGSCRYDHLVCIPEEVGINRTCFLKDLQLRDS